MKNFKIGKTCLPKMSVTLRRHMYHMSPFITQFYSAIFMYLPPNSLKGSSYILILLNEMLYFVMVYQNSVEKWCQHDITFTCFSRGDSMRLYVKTFKFRISAIWNSRVEGFFFQLYFFSIFFFSLETFFLLQTLFFLGPRGKKKEDCKIR